MPIYIKQLIKSVYRKIEQIQNRVKEKKEQNLTSSWLVSGNTFSVSYRKQILEAWPLLLHNIHTLFSFRRGLKGNWRCHEEKSKFFLFCSPSVASSKAGSIAKERGELEQMCFTSHQFRFHTWIRPFSVLPTIALYEGFRPRGGRSDKAKLGCHILPPFFYTVLLWSCFSPGD